MHSCLCGASSLPASEEIKVRTLHRGRHLKVNNLMAVNNEVEGAWKETLAA